MNRVARASLLLLPLLLAACGPGAPAPAPTPSAPTPGGPFAARVLALTNAARAQPRACGTDAYAATTPLTYSAQLEQAAQAHAADLAARNYFSHTSPEGRTAADRVTATGYVWRQVAENIAAGQPTPEEVVAGWLRSPGHCANIMDPGLKDLGVGYIFAAGTDFGHYWVQNFGARN
ncbi:CAP domain-containing protein [Deinococcus ficus]|uniref:CAP domain-containing protein n=1 Tax=Deinococcus ficus TaxID=317577 RepID=UPI0003B77CEC|nr:CAP domain-containing protein [Deinococcus ficus]